MSSVSVTIEGATWLVTSPRYQHLTLPFPFVMFNLKILLSGAVEEFALLVGEMNFQPVYVITMWVQLCAFSDGDLFGPLFDLALVSFVPCP